MMYLVFVMGKEKMEDTSTKERPVEGILEGEKSEEVNNDHDICKNCLYWLFAWKLCTRINNKYQSKQIN